MQERSTGSGTPDARVPRGAAKLPPAPKTTRTPKQTVDKFPKDPAEWKAFAEMPAGDRAAIYLRSIRAMVLFFTILTVIGIITTTILVLVGINAANNTTTSNPFG
jgi:hypothetical protein